jgi:TrmH family RNA methyltransferase
VTRVATGERLTVVVVDAETPGNVGTIARAMKNFGVHDLRLVNPPPIEPGDEAHGFASHAREDVLPNAREVTFDEVVENYHTVGCTATAGSDDRHHVRFPYRTPAELADGLREVDARTALVFGREGDGLSNAELARLDEVCCIPASADYPVLNLGQAATVVLYELRELTVGDSQLPDVDRQRAAEPEIERLYEFFDRFLDGIDHRPHKRDATMNLLRRLVGRAHPTGREVHTLLGVFRRANTLLDHRRELIERYDEPEWPGAGDGSVDDPDRGDGADAPDD